MYGHEIIAITVDNVQPAVNRQPGYRWGTRRASSLENLKSAHHHAYVENFLAEQRCEK